MSKALIQVANQSSQTVAVNSIITLGSVQRRFGCACRLSGNAIELTEFELLTAIAFLYFSDEKVDVAIFETGLGGRFDATNVSDKNLCSVITSISFDHTERLGNTIDEIALQKAGIIKSGAYVAVSKENKGYKIINKKIGIKPIF